MWAVVWIDTYDEPYVLVFDTEEEATQAYRNSVNEKHEDLSQFDKDDWRDYYINDSGVWIVRVWNRE